VRRVAATSAFLSSPAAFSTRPAFTYGFRHSYDLPVLLLLWLYGADSAEPLSFLLIG
jgi:hypothetical protein